MLMRSCCSSAQRFSPSQGLCMPGELMDLWPSKQNSLIASHSPSPGSCMPATVCLSKLPSCRNMKLPSCCKSSSWQKGSFLTGSCSKEQKHSTRGSRVIPQHSTNLAQTRLTSEIGRDRVLSGWYDRAMRLPHLLRLYMLACWLTERSTD